MLLTEDCVVCCVVCVSVRRRVFFLSFAQSSIFLSARVFVDQRCITNNIDTTRCVGESRPAAVEHQQPPCERAANKSAVKWSVYLCAAKRRTCRLERTVLFWKCCGRLLVVWQSFVSWGGESDFYVCALCSVPAGGV